MPVRTRKGSALLLHGGSETVLIDCGEGVTQSLIERNCHVNAISRIYLSHTHPDHVAGLPMLLQWMKLGKRTAPLYIVCDGRNHVWLHETLRGMFLIPSLWDFRVAFLDFSESDGPGSEQLSITASENTHLAGAHHLAEEYGITAASYSFHAQWGGEEVFISSDIGSLDDIKPHLSRARVAIVEGTHVDIDSLLTFCGEWPDLRFFITHISPELDSRIESLKGRVKKEFGWRLSFAYDGMEAELLQGVMHG